MVHTMIVEHVIPSTSFTGCMDESACDYDAGATIQATEESTMGSFSFSGLHWLMVLKLHDSYSSSWRYVYNCAGNLTF